MENLGLSLIICTILIISYIDYRNGAKNWFFEDKTTIEKNKRQIQLLESQLKILKLQKQIKNITKSNTEKNKNI